MQVFGLEKGSLPKVVATKLPLFSTQPVPKSSADVKQLLTNLKDDNLKMQELES